MYTKSKMETVFIDLQTYTLPCIDLTQNIPPIYRYDLGTAVQHS